MYNLPSLSIKDYKTNQIVFIKSSNQNSKPAKVIQKSSYGTYLIKIYGNKDVSYASEYTMTPYAEAIAIDVA
jgi:hypothetical protein